MPSPMMHTRDIEVLRTQFAAWMAGAKARACKWKLCENPHQPRSAAGDAWENGWEVIDSNLPKVGT